MAAGSVGGPSDPGKAGSSSPAEFVDPGSAITSLAIIAIKQMEGKTGHKLSFSNHYVTVDNPTRFGLQGVARAFKRSRSEQLGNLKEAVFQGWQWFKNVYEDHDLNVIFSLARKGLDAIENTYKDDPKKSERVKELLSGPKAMLDKIVEEGQKATLDPKDWGVSSDWEKDPLAGKFRKAWQEGDHKALVEIANAMKIAVKSPEEKSDYKGELRLNSIPAERKAAIQKVSTATSEVFKAARKKS